MGGGGGGYQHNVPCSLGFDIMHSEIQKKRMRGKEGKSKYTVFHDNTSVYVYLLPG